MGWSEIGIIHNQRPYAFQNSYKSVDVYQYQDEVDWGLELVLVQSFDGAAPSEWHIHQDLVFALGLLREGDTWLCPREAFLDVVRLKRNDENRPVSVEIRAEFLRDYLAARHMALRLTWYHQRCATVEDASFITWPDGRLDDGAEGHRFEGRCFEVAEGGGPLSGDVAVFHVWRTDVDPGIDVPVFGAESDANTGHTSRTFTRTAEKSAFLIAGEAWRDEWVEPAAHSVRVRNDDTPPTAFFITDAAGTRESRATLNNEDVGKYLWFRSGVITAILQYRGSILAWLTANTGRVELTAGDLVHFGVNKLGLINAYAYDIARLPDWQQQIWAGFNAAPEGGVSEELLAAQMGANPARTTAPEELFVAALDEIDKAFACRYGSSLLREHPSTAEITRSIHRFRAGDQAGLLALAKDIARLTADSIDAKALQAVTAPPKGEKWGSIKSLEKVLATIVPENKARALIAPLVGIYELRLGDAHLPSTKIDEAFKLTRIDRNIPTVAQGAQLLMIAAWTLHRAAEIMTSGESGHLP